MKPFRLSAIPADRIFAAIAALAMFMTRPTAFGDVYSLPGMLIVGACAIGILVSATASKSGPITARSPQTWVYLSFGIYLGLLVLASARSDSLMNTFKACIVTLIGCGFAFTLMADRNRARAFFDTLAIVLIALSSSTLVTFALVFVSKSYPHLAIGRFNYSYAPPAGTILLPFSMLYNLVPTWFGMLPRLDGMFREVGIFPAFACWAAAYASHRRWNVVFSVICLIACVICLSSMGLLCAVICAAGIIGARMRLPWWAYVLVAPAAMLVIVLATYNVPYIGIGYKYAHDPVSYADRANAISAITDGNLLFGGESENRNAGINLVSSIIIWGIVGVAPIFIYMLLAATRLRYFCAALLPAFLVALVSEPIAQEPFFFVLFLSWCVFEPVAVKRPRSAPAQRARPLSPALG